MADSIKKKKYKKPELHHLGSLKKLSQTDSSGPKVDGGIFPNNKHMCLTPPSALEEHRILLRDRTCQNAYRQEIFRQVREGDVVLDLGTGSGIHAIFALMAGARHVYAIDLNPLIEVAKEVVSDNGFSDRVTFIQKYSREVQLDEKVDVIIANIGFLHTLNDLPDVVSRFLKPGGRVLPEAAALTFVPVEASDIFSTHIENWEQNTYGVNFSAFKRLAVNHPIYWELGTRNMLAAPSEQNQISFLQEVPKKLEWECDFTIRRAGVLHGMGGWYSFFSGGEPYLTTAPPMTLERDLWQNFVFPFEKCLAVKPNDRLRFQVQMYREVLGEAPIWKWDLIKNDRREFSQSSFSGVPFLGISL